MSERSVESVREEIAAERQRLDQDIVQLRSEIRSLAVFVALGLVVVGCVTFFLGKRQGARTIWRLIR
jgi:hypothetical protein